MGFSGETVSWVFAVAERKAQGLQAGLRETWEDNVTNCL